MDHLHYNATILHVYTMYMYFLSIHIQCHVIVHVCVHVNTHDLYMYLYTENALQHAHVCTVHHTTYIHVPVYIHVHIHARVEVFKGCHEVQDWLKTQRDTADMGMV